MGRISRATDGLCWLVEELEAVRLDRCGGPLGVMPQVRQALGMDAVVYTRILEQTTGWALEGFESDGLPDATRFRRALAKFLVTRPEPVPWIDLAHPDAGQCNTVVSLTDEPGRAADRASEIFDQVIKPAGLRDHHLVGVLLCEDGMVRGWIGGFSATPIDQSKRRMLEQIAAPLRIRMRMERLLGAAPRVQAALDATLQQIGAPALLVDGRGRIHEMNRAARDLLNTKREDVTASVAALLAKREPRLPLRLVPVTGTGVNEQFLVVRQPRSSEARISLAITLAAYRWNLTPRQLEVLEPLIRGESNRQIAERLTVSLRAIELPITALFDKAKVSNRSQLVAAVLLG